MKVFVFLRLCNTFPRVKRYVMELNVFMGYLEKDIAYLVNPSRHEQYPSNNLDQNNLTHGVIV